MMKTLFLHPPSFDGFDGGAGSRYQAKREIRSFWYPTWLAQPAALVPDSRLIDAPPAKLKLADVLAVAEGYELAVLHTSTPSFASDVRVAEAMNELSGAERAAFVLRHFEGLPIEDVGRVLGCQPGAAKHSVFRAVQKLRRALEPLASTVK